MNLTRAFMTRDAVPVPVLLDGHFGVRGGGRSEARLTPKP